MVVVTYKPRPRKWADSGVDLKVLNRKIINKRRFTHYSVCDWVDWVTLIFNLLLFYTLLYILLSWKETCITPF